MLLSATGHYSELELQTEISFDNHEAHGRPMTVIFYVVGISPERSSKHFRSPVDFKQYYYTKEHQLREQNPGKETGSFRAS